MSAGERAFRSKLAQAVDHQGLLHGTLLRRTRVCGKPRCRCMRGQKHESLYLVVRQGGRTRQVFIPKDWEARVTQWVQEYRNAQELLDEISQACLERVRNRQD